MNYRVKLKGVEVKVKDEVKAKIECFEVEVTDFDIKDGIAFVKELPQMLRDIRNVMEEDNSKDTPITNTFITSHMHSDVSYTDDNFNSLVETLPQEDEAHPTIDRRMFVSIQQEDDDDITFGVSL